MRHRGEHNQPARLHSNGSSQFESSAGTLNELMVTPPVLPGRHRAKGTAPRIPVQALPTHDALVHDSPTPPEVPDKARWRASHLPRTVAASALVIGAVGFVRLTQRFAESHSVTDFVSLLVGLVVIVGLWAAVIASTPQVVRLNGSRLTVHNTRGSETFDLADALQPVDLVGNPRTSHWAVLLHRPNSTTVVLRRKEVVATELDPIVRHYRMVAAKRHSEREARFNS